MSAGYEERLRGVMAVDPAATAIVEGDRQISWGALDDTVAAIDAALSSAGIGKGHRTGVMIRNRAPQVAAMLALFTSERALVVLNPVLARDKLIADIEGLELAAIIAEDGDLDPDDIAAAVESLSCAVIGLALDGTVKLRQRLRGEILHDSDPTRIRTAVEMLTSGTTGPPKRVPLSRKAFDAALNGALVYEKERGVDDAPRLRSGVSLQVGPLAHMSGMFGMLNTLLAGRKLVLFERFQVQAWRDAVVRFRPKVASLVPAALRMVLDADLPSEDLASFTALRSGTAPLPPETVQEFLDRYDLPVLQNYGATEFIGGVSGWTLPDFRRYFKDKPRSCGRIHDGVAARVIDPGSGVILPAGAEGVLELKTAQIDGGTDWYRTTDRAIIDADNFLTICGRTDQAILRGGFKVHPEEVAAVLMGHAAVREAVVVGVPHARLGAVPVAAVIVREGATLEAEELTAFARAHLSAYQVPADFVFVDELPRTLSLKPALPQVTALIAAKLGGSSGD